MRVRLHPKDCTLTPAQLAAALRRTAGPVAVQVIPSIGPGPVHLHARVLGEMADDALAQVQEVLDRHRGWSISRLLSRSRRRQRHVASHRGGLGELGQASASR